MAIQSLILHRIERYQEDQPAAAKLADQPAQVNADYEALFSQLKKLFQFKAGKLFGDFDPEAADTPFKAWLNDYLSEKIPFERLSLLYCDALKACIEKTSELFDGYICMIHEDRADGPRLYIFVIETSSGMQITSGLTLDTIEHVNSSKLDLAVRIELGELADHTGDEPPLVVVKARGAGKLGEAFAQSIGFKSSIDTAKETESLIEVLANYTSDEDPGTSAALRQKAYDFCVEQQQLGESVPLDELSGFLDENQPTKFAEYAKTQNELNDIEVLHPDTRKLKHLVRLSGKGNGLSLSFSSDLIQQTILFDEKQDTLTITAIPKSLKKQLMEHLSKPEE